MLKRVLTETDILLAGIGYIIGGGIFTLISSSTKYSKGYTWLTFLVSGIIIYLTASSYQYLAPYLTHADSEYNIVNKYLGETIAKLFNGGIVIATPFITATIALGMSYYISKLTGIKNAPIIIGGIIILLAGFVNLIGIKESINITNGMTIMETIALIVIAVLGFFNYNTTELSISPTKFTNLIKSSFIIMFAYMGFESLPKLSEETINPQIVIPNAIKNSVIITTILYTLVALSVISILGVKDTINSKTPLGDVMNKISGKNFSNLINIIAMVSIGNTVLMSNIVGSRSLYGLSKKEKLLETFKYISPTTKTPIMAIVFVTILSMIFLIIFKDIEVLAKYANIFTFITLIIINIISVMIRKEKENIYDIRGIAATISIVLYLVYTMFEL